jgi:NAD(P)-dependent dehydrogenase (short-subunit alcohol dehydrogenase family)
MEEAEQMNQFELNGLTALVTGCDREDARRIAELLALSGADVAMQYELAEEEVSTLTERIRQAGGKVVPYCKTLETYEGAEALAQELFLQNGTVNILINDLKLHRNVPIRDLTLEQWNESLEYNLYSVFHISKCISSWMTKQGSGSIVNITSSVPLSGTGGGTDFSASEAAVHGMTLAMAGELAESGIRVNAIAPNGALFQGNSSVELLAVFLASPMSGGISGEIFRLDGVACRGGAV